MTITATTLYNYVQCPTRVSLDYFGDPAERDPVDAFIAMLWERGTLYEQEIIQKGDLEYLDLSTAEGDEKERLTLKAMQSRVPLIYSGRIVSADLVGIPDLLRWQGGGYIPIDIKSGRGEEDGGEQSEGKPKLHYAVQLGLYVDILEQLGLSAARRGFILDISGQEIEYDFESHRGVRIAATLWEEYQGILQAAREIADGSSSPKGALASACKLCHWYSSCTKTLREANDLTLIPGLGRAVRDSLEEEFEDVAALAGIEPEAFITKSSTPFKGVGAKTLIKFNERAKLLTDPNAKPYLKAPITLPRSSVELFFDIEVDPLRDITYLHGIVERRDGDNASEKFIHFFAEDESEEAEKKAFAQSYEYLTHDPEVTIWYYSKYERTIYRKLQARYPDVCSPEAIEELFNPARTVDLYYDVVFKVTEWPTNNHSIKTLAQYLGFEWRDNNPSGAASIEWFDQWVKTRNEAVKTRILDYNEDDCRATRVLLDGIRNLD
ncbi:MAG: putative RecB family nuclease [Parasphingorhabdus sp.]|jgi:predicted RecB family nuclease|uniref:TM0106 family RecB-like putative nuclease n=1 Tax=Parasphingorhabdus sp. TaxID=2709688 RepID=UPI0039E60121